MHIGKKLKIAATAICLAAGLETAPVQAAYAVNMAQVGGNVVATGSGSFNLSGLTFRPATNLFAGGFIWPNAGPIGVGDYALADAYSGLTSFATFGTGNTASPNTNSGPGINISAGFSEGEVFVPRGYVSGTALATSTSIWTNSSLASLGLNPGTYVWSWGSGNDADTFTLNIASVTPSVPEPATWAMMLFGFGAVGGALRKTNGRRRFSRYSALNKGKSHA